MKIKVLLSIKVLGLNSQKFQWEQWNQLNNHDYQTKKNFFFLIEKSMLVFMEN